MSIRRWAALAASVGVVAVAARGEESAIGKPAPAFTLKSAAGHDVTLAQLKGKPVVLEWINLECPFVRKHYGSGNMQRLQRTYTGKGVQWYAVCSSAPGKQGYLEPAEWQKRMKEQDGAPTAVLIDADGTVGKAYGAKTTPHMYVIDREGVLAYSGAIDDKPSTDPATVTGAVNYVSQALDAVLEGKAVGRSTSTPYGCSVKY